MEIHVPKVAPCERDIHKLSDERTRWMECVLALDVDLLDQLADEGFDFAAGTKEASSPFGNSNLLFDIERACRDDRSLTSQQARLFLLHLLEKGYDFGGAPQSTYTVGGPLVKLFADDIEVFSALEQAGFNFKSTDGRMAAGYADSKNLLEHLKRGDGTGAGWLLGHGYRLVTDAAFADMVWKEWGEHPDKLGRSMELAQRSSIEQPGWILPILAGAGLVPQLMAMENWAEAWSRDSLQAAVETATEMQEVQAAAYLIHRQSELFGEVPATEDRFEL